MRQVIWDAIALIMTSLLCVGELEWVLSRIFWRISRKGTENTVSFHKGQWPNIAWDNCNFKLFRYKLMANANWTKKYTHLLFGGFLLFVTVNISIHEENQNTIHILLDRLYVEWDCWINTCLYEKCCAKSGYQGQGQVITSHGICGM